MGKIVVTEFLSLDGVMEAPHEWHFPFFNDEMGQFKYDELFASDALLLGRVTYEGFAAAWPSRSGSDDEENTGGFADRMNNLPKYVVSTTLESAEWNNSTIIRENVPEELAKLKQQHTQDILLCGSADLVNSLMQEDLIDEYRLMIHPIVVGHGKHLFADGIPSKTLKLTDVRTYDTGGMVLTFEPARE